MKETIFSLALLISASAISAQDYPGYSLLWSDEFDGGYSNADTETGLNLDTWNFETGNGDWGWGTGQRDYATTDIENVEVSNGTLKIRTQRHNTAQTQEYTSGRINSKDKRNFTFGKIEARIRTVNMTEKGRGFAFWLMPNGKYNGTQNLMWPQGGEIDIFEYNGMYPQYNLGSVHHAWKWNNNQWGGDGNHAHSGSIYNPLDRNFQYHNVGRSCGNDNMTENKTNLLGADWHIYGINWYEDRIEFYVDQDVYHVFYYYDETWCGENQTNDLGNHVNKAGFNFNKIENDNGVNQSHGSKWRPFENPFYIILSAGVGGDATYGGNITAGNNPDKWTCTTEIDWVRVYQSGSDIITATTSTETGINIFTTDNSVVIRNAPKGALVKIIGIDGIVHYLATCTSSSEISIPLSSGYYVICCNDVAQKVLIR